MQGYGRIIAPDFCVAHREANSGLSTLNRTKSILSIYHQQRQLQKQRGMCLNDTYPFCQQPLSGNCHSICFSKPVLWTATPCSCFLAWGVLHDKSFQKSNQSVIWYILISAHTLCSLYIIANACGKCLLQFRTRFSDEKIQLVQLCKCFFCDVR